MFDTEIGTNFLKVMAATWLTAAMLWFWVTAGSLRLVVGLSFSTSGRAARRR